MSAGPVYFDDGDEGTGFDDSVAATPSALDIELCSEPTNDAGNVVRLEKRFPDQFWFTSEWGPGGWDGKRFDFKDGKARIGRAAMQVATSMLALEVAAFQRTQRGPRETRQEFKKRFDRFAAWALRSGDAARCGALEEQAKRKRMRPLADFNAEPGRLVVANGTICLPRDGSEPQFEPTHDPAHLVTCATLAAYDPQAKAPTFEAFLNRVQPKPEVRAYLMRLIGYCLTGYTEEQAYWIFQGTGGDGKSTFLTAIAATLGSYVSNADANTFLKRDKRGAEHSADVARLASGPRLVKAAEPEHGAQFAEAMLKSITGGEPIVARGMYREPFEFTPTWKLIFSCNYKPQIRGDDRGIWRRTKVLHWPVSLDEAEFDKQLDDKLEAERDGILNLVLAGWADWAKKGLAPPQDVLDATNEYRFSSNPFGAWFDACCVTKGLGPNDVEASSTLYNSYKAWVEARGFTAMEQAAFGRRLGERGLLSYKATIMMRRGVKLNEAGLRAQYSRDDG